MLTPIPSCMLTDTVTFHIVQDTDVWGAHETRDIVVSKCHLQDESISRKTAENTTLTLRGILFVDSRRSTPVLDYMALKDECERNGGELTCTIRGRDYTILTVDDIPNVPATSIHHVEMELY